MGRLPQQSLLTRIRAVVSSSVRGPHQHEDEREKRR